MRWRRVARIATLEIGIRIDPVRGLAYLGVEEINRRVAAGAREAEGAVDGELFVGHDGVGVLEEIGAEERTAGRASRGMTEEQSRASWARVCADATDRFGRCRHDHAMARFQLGPEIRPGSGTTAELRAELNRLVGEPSRYHYSTIEPAREAVHNRYTASISRLRTLVAERGDNVAINCTHDCPGTGAVQFQIDSDRRGA